MRKLGVQGGTGGTDRLSLFVAMVFSVPPFGVLGGNGGR
jgi:hypothetical protein